MMKICRKDDNPRVEEVKNEAIRDKYTWGSVPKNMSPTVQIYMENTFCHNLRLYRKTEVYWLRKKETKKSKNKVMTTTVQKYIENSSS